MKETPNGDEMKAFKARLGTLINRNQVTSNSVKVGTTTYEATEGVLTGDEAASLKQGNALSKTLTLGDGTKFWSLKPDEHILIFFGVKLSENAGNEFQGVHYNAAFKVEAKQTDAGALYGSDINTVK